MFGLEELGLAGLFFASFLAATFLPFSSELILSVLITQNFNKIDLILVATAGNPLGSIVNYFIGHFGKLEWARKHLKMSRKTIVSYQGHILKYGHYLGLITWLPIIGDPLSLALGYFRVPWKSTFLFIFLGKLLRYIAVVYLVSS